MITCSIPAATASSTAYWMTGLSTRGSISLGWALVAGRKRVPQPAAGKTALRTRIRPQVEFGVGAPSIRPSPSTAARTASAGRLGGGQPVLHGVQRRLRPAGQTQLPEDVAHVGAGRPFRDDEAVGDGLVAQAV